MYNNTSCTILHAGVAKQDPGSLEPKVSRRYCTSAGACVLWGSKLGSVIRKVSCRERHNACPKIGRVPLHHVLDKQVASQASALPLLLHQYRLSIPVDTHRNELHDQQCVSESQDSLLLEAAAQPHTATVLRHSRRINRLHRDVLRALARLSSV